MVAQKPLLKHYGLLTVTAQVGCIGICDCLCGAKGIQIDSSALRLGHTKSCGCHKREVTRRMAKSRAKPVSGKMGRLTIISQDGGWVVCDCDCGTRGFRTRSGPVLSGRTRSCGCLRRERGPKTAKEANTTHGLSKRTEYTIWVDMRRRCYKPQRPDYHRYGGRGITVCDRWKEDFEAFYADMGPRPDRHTLERRNNDGPYSPDNCYWAPLAAQHNNKRTSRFILVDGEKMTFANAERKLGLPRNTITRRLRLGWTHAQAIAIPPLTPQQNLARRQRGEAWS